MSNTPGAESNGAGGGEARAARTLVGGYEVLAKIGQGGMGAVFRARQLSIGRIVALKLLPPRLAKSQKYIARFLREAQSAARFRHPNVVQAIDAGSADGYYYFAMEFVDGPSLKTTLKAAGRLPERRALEIARDVARGLEAAHSAGIIHRDVKPDNILLAPDGSPKLADLGLARQTDPGDSSVTQAGEALGTPDYIPPEQVRGQTDLDGRTDLYALGATLYHLLTGSPPYTGGTKNEVMAKHISAPVPDPRAANPQLSPAAAAVVRKAMAKDRADRYASAGEMIEDIERVLRGEAPIRAPAPAPHDTQTGTRIRRAKRPARTAWPWAAGILILAAAGAFFALRGPGRERTEPPVIVTPPDHTSRPATAKSKDDQLFEGVRKWVKDHPDRYREAVQRWNAAVGQIRDPAVAMKAQAALDEIEAARGKAADAALAQLALRADALAKAGDYDGAAAQYRNPPAEFDDLLAERAATALARISDEAEARVSKAVAEAEKLSKEGRPADALAELDRLSGVRYARRAAELKALRDRLDGEGRDAAEIARKRSLAAADAALRRLLADLDAAVAKGALADAPALVRAALADPALKPLESAVQRVAAAAQALAELPAMKRAATVEAFKALIGKTVTLRTAQGAKTGKVKSVTDRQILLDRSFVINDQTFNREEAVALDDVTPDSLAEYKADWQPKNADEAAALALMLAAGRDAARLDAALKLAGDHPLTAFCAAKLAALRQGDLEIAARKEWDSILPYTTKPSPTAAEVAALLRRLKDFETRFGATQFAASVKDRIALMRSVHETTPGADLALADVQKLFKGKVTAFDPKIAEVKLEYNFEDPAQLDDLEPSRWDWQKKGRPEIKAGALVLANTRIQVLTKARFTAVCASVDFAITGDKGGATLVIFSDGQGSHYELCASWPYKDPPVWRCQIYRYVKGAFSQEEVDRGKWPIQPSPFGAQRKGSMTLAFARGELVGSMATLTLRVRDDVLKSGSVGVWAYDAESASFDNLRITGRLESQWLADARKAAEDRAAAAKTDPPAK